MGRNNPVVDNNNWIVCSKVLWPAGLDHYEKKALGDLVFARCDDGRFSLDRCIEQVDPWFILFHGVLLNKHELYGKRAAQTVSELLAGLIADMGTGKTLDLLRGPFEGAFYETETQVLQVFGNQTGDTAAYYYQDKDLVVTSNSFDLMHRVLSANKIDLTFDERAARMMLSYGFMTDDSTFAKEIRRVLPGHYFEVDLKDPKSSMSHEYWRLQYTPHETMTIDEAVEIFDSSFTAAVVRCFDKDLEYGYKDHLADISGGLDARMVNLIAKKMGYKQITNVTYSETGSEEQKYAIDASIDLENDCFYFPMDGGKCILDPASFLELNSGAAIYSGITGGKAVLERLNFDRFGLEHTGQLGDAIFVTYARSDEVQPPNLDAEKYSLIHSFDGLIESDEEEPEEIFQMRTRGFLGTNSSHLLRSHYTYGVAPFLDIDLLQKAFSVPLRLRYKHRTYEKWIKERHPEALNAPTSRRFPSERDKIDSRSTAERYFRWGLFRMKRGIHRFVKAPAPVELSLSMNPLQEWFDVNRDLQDMVASKQQAASNMDVSPSLRSDLAKSFGEQGAIQDKFLATTVVAMYQLYFQGRKEA